MTTKTLPRHVDIEVNGRTHRYYPMHGPNAGEIVLSAHSGKPWDREDSPAHDASSGVLLDSYEFTHGGEVWQAAVMKAKELAEEFGV